MKRCDYLVKGCQRNVSVLMCLMLSMGLLISGCSSMRFVPEDKFLLKKDPSVKGAKSVDTYYAIRTKANRRMLMGPKTFLYIYNLGKALETDSSLVKKILLSRESVSSYYYPLILKVLTRDIGEPPVLYNYPSLQQDSINLRNLYFANGFFRPEIKIVVKDTAYKSNPFYYPKAKVTFEITEGPASIIDSLSFIINDKQVEDIYLRHLSGSFLNKGENYNHDKMGKERERIAAIMRNEGYFNFSPSMITFQVDTSTKRTAPPFKNEKTNLEYWDRYLKVNTIIKDTLIQYRIGEIKDSIISAYNTQEDLFANFRTDKITPQLLGHLEIPPAHLQDTTLHIRYSVSRSLLKELNFDFLGRKVKLTEGDLYSRDKAVRTQRGMQALTMFQYVTITYTPNDSLQKLDVKITGKLAPRFQLKAGAESFTNVVNDNSTINSAFNISMGINGSLRDRNTFTHSEQSELSGAFLVGLYQTNAGTDSARLRFLYEVRSKASIDFPRFITPLPKFNRRDYSMLNPKTSVAGSFRFESRREYQRITLSSNYTYKWNHIPYSTLEASTFSPVALDIISVPQALMSDDFRQQIDSLPLLKRDFLPRFSSRIVYTYTHTDYMGSPHKPTHFFRVTLEEGGTLPYLIDRITQSPQLDTSYKDHTLFSQTTPIDYGRFVKSTVEGKLFIPLWSTGQMVLRGFAGWSIRMKNTPVLPIQNRFYAGSTNGMRGWRSNLLGPGTSEAAYNPYTLPPGGDFMLEANAEFRFKVWSYINLAFFTDVGNVWLPNNQYVIDEYGGEATLRKENLLPGWDVGTGLRLDFSFLILRLDFAQQMYIPQYKTFFWNVIDENYLDTLNTNIGIGYPF
ncbi:MAG: BamA/TamA family outer membrane protein [Bacteroidia bacterium]|nr:BamA/TamA family outer membrane protein [Bacteroidia bacterium]